MKLLNLFGASDSSIAHKSVPAEIGDLFQFSVHIAFSGDESGTLKLEASNIGGVDDDNWILVPNSTVSVSSGEHHMWNITGASYRFIRTVWTPTSGSGTISGYLVMKEPINRF